MCLQRGCHFSKAEKTGGLNGRYSRQEFCYITIQMKVILHLQLPMVRSLHCHYLQIHAYLTINGLKNIQKCCKTIVLIKEQGKSIDCLNET